VGTMISLQGMYDLHVHASPSVACRKLSALEALKLASKEGMGGILLLDHTYNTVVVAQVLNELGYETNVFGSILLNESVGGLNPSVVETAILFGTKQIQMPTYSAQNHKEKFSFGDDQRIFPYPKKSKGIYILDDKDRIISEVDEILQLLKGSESFLGTGHLSVVEIKALVNRAKELNVRVLVNGASSSRIGLPIEIQKKLADDNVFMEYDYVLLTENVHKKRAAESIVEQIRGVGAERCVIATDAGQPNIPDLVKGFKDFIKQLLQSGISENEIEFMTRKNPCSLLGIQN
jgi:hypothetical protein